MANHDSSGRRSKAWSPRSLVTAILASLPIAAGAADLAGTGEAPVAAVPRSVVAGGFTLGLEASLGVEPERLAGLDPTGLEPERVAGLDPAATRPIDSAGQNGSLSLGDVRAIAGAMRQETPQSAPTEKTPSYGSFGRWMKQHWWVGVLVGAAVVAVAGESLWDDDDQDDDR